MLTMSTIPQAWQNDVLVAKEPYLYYISKKTGWVGLENGYFCWHSELNLCWYTIVGRWVRKSPKICWHNIRMVPKVAANLSFSCFWNSQLSTATKSDRESSLATKLGSHFKFESSDIFSGSKNFRLKFGFMYPSAICG